MTTRQQEQAMRKVEQAAHYFEMLGVTAMSDEHELRKARRDLAKYLHPDVNRNSKAGRLMSEVNVACYTLLDKKQRLQYMASLPQRECAECCGKGRRTKQQGFTRITWTVCNVCKGSGRG